MRRLLLWLGLCLSGAVGAPAWAVDPLEAAQLAELDRVRAEVADQVQLSAYDLVDELVYGWTREPVFSAPTAVVLAGVTVPVGLGTGLQALIENHLAGVLIQNPTTNVQLVHCPACTAVVVHSGPEGTVVSRGLDSPAVLEELGGGGSGRYALFVDIEAEGAWLVLRARLTRLTPELPIVWSHTIATSASTPALLRQPSALTSAAEARQAYLDVLRERGPAVIPLRFTIRSYARPNVDFGEAVPPPPFLWLQTGVELGATPARTWTSSMLLGYSIVPQAYQGLMAQARVSRLISGRVHSLTRPDLYAFAGGAVMTVWGPATAAFRERVLTLDEILGDIDGDDPRNTFSALHLGLDLRIGNRIGFSGFLETVPSLRNSQNLGSYVTIGSLDLQTFGTEVTFCF